MTKRSSLDPIAEAQARVRLRAQRARKLNSGPANLGPVLRRIARKSLPVKGASLARLALDWSSIVGPQLAGLCHPEKLSPARGGQNLTLRVIPAAAPIVEHQSELIRQRVSVAAGGHITRLTLLHGLIRSGPKDPKPYLRALSEAEDTYLQMQTAEIEDKKLRAAIVALGRAVLLSAEAEADKTEATTSAPLPF